MEIARKIGIGVVMVIPAFVGGGAGWNIFHSWIAVFLWLVLMAIGYWRIITA